MAALTFIIERLFHLRENLVAPPRLIDEVIGVMRQSLPSTEVTAKLEANSVLGGVLAAGIRAVVADPRIEEDALRQSFENAGRRAMHGLERYLNMLGTIAAAAPLLGLAGHGDRHDRDLRLAGARQQLEPPAAGPRHLGGAVQHRPSA